MNMPYNQLLDIKLAELHASSLTDSKISFERTTRLELPRLSPEIALKLGRLQAANDFRTGLPLFILDAVATLAALCIAYQANLFLTGQPLVGNILFFPSVVGLTWLIQHVHGLYPACGMCYSIEFRRTLRTCLMVTAGIGVGFLVRENDRGFPIIGLLVFAFSLVLFLCALRPIARRILSRFDWWVQPVAVIGSTDFAIDLHERISKCRQEGLRSIGVVFDPNEHWSYEQSDNRDVFVGPITELESILAKTRTCRVAVAQSKNTAIMDFERYLGIPHVMLPTGLSRRPTEKAQLFERDGQVELHCYHAITSPSALFAKRAMDLILVFGLMPFWLPVMVAIGIAIKWRDPGPMFYRMVRVGRFGKTFQMIKFRSMVCNADQKLKAYLLSHPELQAEWGMRRKLKNDPRVTWIGKFLRKSSLDELPQLLNVLWGDMSLVGIRPLIDRGDYDREFIKDHPELFELYQYVRPGITGLWQVSGRNNTSYEQRIHFDRLYLHNWSVMMDVFILWRTIKTAIFREGAY